MILLDTQALAWLVGRPQRLSRVARRSIEKESRSKGLSIASATLFELAQLSASGEVVTARTPAEWLKDLVGASGVAVRELTTDIAVVAAHLPPTFPYDPFDRIIAATAIVERIPLVTSDRRIRGSGVVRTIW